MNSRQNRQLYLCNLLQIMIHIIDKSLIHQKMY